MSKRFSTYCLFIGLFFLSPWLHAEIYNDRDLDIKQLASDLSVPWGMVILPDQRNALITQRSGKLVKLNLNTQKIEFITGLPEAIFVQGQGGLFDIALPPDFTHGDWIYFSYAKQIDNKGATTLARAHLKQNSLVDWQDILVSKSLSKTKAHFGGRITFDDAGHVFLSIGERAHRPNAQDLSNHAGKILRLNLDGSIPADNPFIHQAGALPEIWSYGHRNPQGLYYNLSTHQLWEIEHGPRGGDEINLIQPGHNYGWPEISYGKEYWAPLPVGKGTHQQGMDQPVKTYIPSIAPSSLIQYQGDLFKNWKGNLLAGALSLQHLNRIVLDKNNQPIEEQRLLETLGSRIRNVVEGPQGELYIATDSGDIYRIRPTANNE